MTDILDELRWRGLIAHSTDESALAEAIDAGMVTFYVGFDPTAPSMHVGHLVQVITASRLQQAGLRPLLLVGGATGLIGDPKQSAERKMNEVDVVAGWAERLRQQMLPYINFDGPNGALMVNNLDWTQNVSVLDFLRDVGKHFSVNRMLDREAVAVRLASTGISYTEFSYVLLQSNDFLQLHRQFGCTLQLGGSDQWGNITAGCELIRRVDGVRTHAFATPLVTKADGTKFGKTESGTIWLDPNMTPPYEFFQFWLNAGDGDIGGYLRYFSFRTREELEALDVATAERPFAREAQRALAQDLTDLVHGRAERERVEQAALALFGRAELADLDERTLNGALAEVPQAAADLSAGDVSVVDVLVATGLSASRGAARRTIAEGGAYVNNAKVSAEDELVSASDALAGGWLVLRRGKRNIAAVKVSGQ